MRTLEATDNNNNNKKSPSFGPQESLQFPTSTKPFVSEIPSLSIFCNLFIILFGQFIADKPG